VDLADLTAGSFSARIGDVFHLAVPGASLPFALTEVEEFGLTPSGRNAFSLHFLAPGPFLPQGIYPLVHAELGRLEIFLVPLGPREAGNLYESIFT
jgi:hypothetical protein